MSLSGFLVGVGLFILCIFLAMVTPEFITGISKTATETVQIFLFFIGFIAIFVGALDK